LEKIAGSLILKNCPVNIKQQELVATAPGKYFIAHCQTKFSTMFLLLSEDKSIEKILF